MPTTKPIRPNQLPPSGMTRSQVAHQLGIGVTAVHRLRVSGELHPQRDDAGVWRYDPADVIRAAARRGVRGPRTEGETAARAFEMFEMGAGLREVVMALHLTPEQVRQLYSDFKSSLYSPEE
ncbi:MAG TPA: helix-turn-helix domain-containing protein [Polyangia bacterium]|nr:helix-turn-helix domain-containing protein [Polyangia bacterium]